MNHWTLVMIFKQCYLRLLILTYNSVCKYCTNHFSLRIFQTMFLLGIQVNTQNWYQVLSQILTPAILFHTITIATKNNIYITFFLYFLSTLYHINISKRGSKRYHFLFPVLVILQTLVTLVLLRSHVPWNIFPNQNMTNHKTQNTINQ